VHLPTRRHPAHPRLRRGRQLSRSSIGVPSPDLGAVDDLCRLALVAQRLGCTMRLTGVSDELRVLLDLAGVTGLVLDEQVDLDRKSDRNGTDLR